MSTVLLLLSGIQPQVVMMSPMVWLCRCLWSAAWLILNLGWPLRRLMLTEACEHSGDLATWLWTLICQLHLLELASNFSCKSSCVSASWSLRDSRRNDLFSHHMPQSPPVSPPSSELLAQDHLLCYFQGLRITYIICGQHSKEVSWKDLFWLMTESRALNYIKYLAQMDT